MNPPTEQLIRDYLNRVSLAARGRLDTDDRRAFLARTHEFIEQNTRALGKADSAGVDQLLSRLGDPAALVARECDRLAARQPAGDPATGSAADPAADPAAGPAAGPAADPAGGPRPGRARRWRPARGTLAGLMTSPAIATPPGPEQPVPDPADDAPMTGELRFETRPITARWRPGSSMEHPPPRQRRAGLPRRRQHGAPGAGPEPDPAATAAPGGPAASGPPAGQIRVSQSAAGPVTSPAAGSAASPPADTADPAAVSAAAPATVPPAPATVPPAAPPVVPRAASPEAPPGPPAAGSGPRTQRPQWPWLDDSQAADNDAAPSETALDATANGTPARGTAANGKPANGASAGGPPPEAFPADTMPPSGTFPSRAAGNDTAGNDTAGNDMASPGGTSPNGTPVNGAQPSGIHPNGTRPNGTYPGVQPNGARPVAEPNGTHRTEPQRSGSPDVTAYHASEPDDDEAPGSPRAPSRPGEHQSGAATGGVHGELQDDVTPEDLPGDLQDSPAQDDQARDSETPAASSSAASPPAASSPAASPPAAGPGSARPRRARPGRAAASSVAGVVRGTGWARGVRHRSADPDGGRDGDRPGDAGRSGGGGTRAGRPPRRDSGRLGGGGPGEEPFGEPSLGLGLPPGSLAAARDRAGQLIRAAAGRARRRPLEATAVVLLGLGGLIFPPVWLLGAAVALASRVWDFRDKWIGLALPIFLVIAGMAAAVSLGGHHDGVSGYAKEAWLFGDHLSRIVAVLGAVYLAWRAERGRRRPTIPPWTKGGRLG